MRIYISEHEYKVCNSGVLQTKGFGQIKILLQHLQHNHEYRDQTRYGYIQNIIPLKGQHYV